ncbi:MAG: DUF2341 domain-containing protein [Fibrobacter sp.]|nr:DUF2341 domain-containing protein [Fibrobacter sp.]
MNRFLLLAAIFLLLRCSAGPITGGTTDTGNARMAGILVHDNGAAAKHALVRCIPSDYIHGLSRKELIRSAYTNENGEYVFKKLDFGQYVISAVDTLQLTRCMISNALVKDDSITLQVDTLKDAGTITIPIPDNAEFSDGFFYIPGTTIVSQSSNSSTTGFVSLDSVPAGTIPTVNFATETDTLKKVIRYNVDVRSSDTSTIYNLQAKYSQIITINTTSGGADVTGTVTSFPLLVRLTGSEFSFKNATVNGDDLFFTNRNNTILPHEFERWDPSTETAILWVRVDTIYGNSQQHIVLYYGDTNTLSPLFVPVFDTSNGYMGVWHLNESADAADASVHRFNGVRNNAMPSVNGVIDNAQLFADSSTYCEMGNILNPGVSDFTVSAWVRRADTGLSTIAAKSIGGYPSKTYGWNFSFDQYNQLHAYIATDTAPSWSDSSGFYMLYSTAIIRDLTSWHHVAVVFDRSGNTSSRLYIDGESVPFTYAGDMNSVTQVSNTSAFRIGAESDGSYPFKGSIDECRVAFTARSADWIKLCYTNQRKENKLVSIR